MKHRVINSRGFENKSLFEDLLNKSFLIKEIDYAYYHDNDSSKVFFDIDNEYPWSIPKFNEYKLVYFRRPQRPNVSQGIYECYWFEENKWIYINTRFPFTIEIMEL